MFPAIPKPPLSPEERIEKIIKLKPEFDKLSDYKEKLEFWYTNDMDISIKTYGITDEEEKRDLPENNITIYPNNTEEVKAYKKFYRQIFQKDNFNTLETSVARYWDHIDKGANPIPYTKNVLKEIEKEYADHNKFPNTGFNSFRSYCNGFDASENGQMETFLNNSSFHENLHSFFTGEVHEKYKRFLVKQLSKLENANPEDFDVNEKLKISYKLIGENESNSVSPVFHHIKEVLSLYKITPMEARETLLDMQGANSPQMNTNVVGPIIRFLEQIKEPKQNERESPLNSVPENPHPIIFKNGYAYQMFLELKSMTVKKRSIVADYSFIFHKMKDKGLKAINRIVTEPEFVNFLNRNFQTDISGKKLPFKNPDHKQQPYMTILNKYQDNILK